MSFTHILVPTDFSDSANHAVHYAFEEAELQHAKLTLLHVVDHYPYTQLYYVKGTPADRNNLVADLGRTMPAQEAPAPVTIRRDYFEEALIRLRDLVPDSFTGSCNTEVATGDSADAIVRVARDHEVDLIVMGTHGRTGLSHMLLGSVAEKVVRRAPCSVLVTRHGMAEARFKGKEPLSQRQCA